jgi:hypothetical protein
MNPKAKLTYEKVREVRCVTPDCRERHERGGIALMRLVSKRAEPVPRWVKKINREIGSQYLLTQTDWRDHLGYCGEVLISEPYGLTPAGVRELVEFCDRHRLDFQIGACSQHLPTNTLAILVWPREGTTP